jgi:exodeoxyribonuclease VII small subunit
MTNQPTTLKDLLESERYEDHIKNMSFESGLKFLEELVGKVESGGLALDQAIGSYERGVVLIARLRELLSGAEAKLKILNKENA